VAEEYLPKRVLWARKKRHDLTDTSVLWEVIGIDAVILLENLEHRFSIGKLGMV
jgi:hypothetical protein